MFFFIDCIPGKYGADCKQTCSSNCFNNKCDQYTGICYQGCSEGYLPPYCLQSKIQNVTENKNYRYHN